MKLPVAIIASALILTGCTIPAPQSPVTSETRPAPTESEEETTATEEPEDGKTTPPAPMQNIVEPPVSFDLPGKFVKAPDTGSENFTAVYDLPGEDKTSQARIAVAPWVSVTNDPTTAQGLMQARFLFSSTVSQFNTEDQVPIEIEGASDAYTMKYSYTGKDGEKYRGIWWVLWDEETNRSTGIDMQYPVDNETGETIATLITNSMTYDPDQMTPTGPGTPF